jgi:cell division protein FtsB
MRLLALILAALVLALQVPLWFGKGGWLQVQKLTREVETQRAENDKLKSRNAGLDAEVRNLKQGLEAVEERARQDQGLVRRDEIFFQLSESRAAEAPPRAAP